MFWQRAKEQQVKFFKMNELAEDRHTNPSSSLPVLLIRARRVLKGAAFVSM